MKKIVTRNWTRFGSAAAAILLGVGAMPLLARAQVEAQSQSYKDTTGTIVLLTGEHDVRLSVGRSSCTATTDGGGMPVIVIAQDGRCLCWAASSSIPTPLDVKITSTQITFRHDARTYLIRDASAIASARQLFAPVSDAMRSQADVAHRMNSLRATELQTSRSFDETRVSVPNLTAEFERVEADAKHLSIEGATQSELSELQSELSDLQSRISELQSAASVEIGAEKSEMSDRMNSMSFRMHAMGEQMESWNGQGEKAAEEAARQLKSLLDQAIASGIAKPE